VVDPIAAWHAEHVYFGRLLDLFEKEVDTFHRGGRPNYELMRDIVYYLREFADQSHHPREDTAFRILAARRPDLELEFGRLVQEHRVVANAGDALLEQLEAACADIVAPRAALEAAAAVYLTYYRSHIATEEREILPLAAELLTPAEWSAVAASVAAVNDPLFGDQPAERFRELRREISREAS